MTINAETYCGSTSKAIVDTDTNQSTQDLTCTLPAMPTFTITVENCAHYQSQHIKSVVFADISFDLIE